MVPSIGPIDDAGRIDPVAVQRCKEGHGLLASMRHARDQAAAPRCPADIAEHTLSQNEIANPVPSQTNRL